MKIVVHFCRVFTGALFIFSGLIKVNDPVGMAIKLEEYFDIFAVDFFSGFEYLAHISLPIAVFVVVLEVVIGVALLIQYQFKWTSWVLLLLIIFFTFLTFYSAYTGKVNDCGCFGDAIPLTPWQSFSKDVVLLLFSGVIFMWRNKLSSIFTSDIKAHAVMATSLVLSTFLAFYAINHLPFIDFRTYKIGNNIPTLMQPSEPPRFEYVMEKDGELHRFEKYPTDKSYTYKEMVLLNPESEPKIVDYSVWNNEGEFTEESLTGLKLFLIIQDVKLADQQSMKDISKLIGALKEITPMVITSSDEEKIEAFRHEHQLAAPYYFADATVLKTMVRANPGLMLLNNGTVLGKWHYNDVPSKKELLELIK